MSAFKAAMRRRLAVVCAPAGYGKTTATAAIAEREGLDVAWYKLDVLDHDPVVCVVSLTYAMQERRPDFGEILLERVRSSAEVPFRLPDMVAMFVAECSEKMTGDVHIVLDDYQEAADSTELNWTLDYLIENLPQRFRFIVLSRYDPAFSTSKLKLADEFELLGVDVLRFDAEQTAAMMGARTTRLPSPAAIERLVELAEGWAACLVLATFALDWLNLDSLETALVDPRLKHDIYSYLAEQVYLREDAKARHFLEQTCCLGHVTAELGDMLAGIQNAGYQLSQLAAKRVFTFASQKEGAYRYHNLFRDYLRQRFLQEHGAAAFHALRIRTIEALEACHEFELAVDLSLSINESARALDIIARGGEPEFDNIRSESLESWVARLEWSAEASNPWTTLLRSQVHLRASEFHEALEQTDAALAKFGAAEDGLGLYHAYSIRECALFWKGDMAEASDVCEQALAHAQTPAHRAHTLMGLGSAALETRDWSRADAAYARAEEEMRGIESPSRNRLRTLNALMKYYQGDFRGACRQVYRPPRDSLPSVGTASTLNSVGVFELGMARYEEARTRFEQALAYAELLGCDHLKPLILDCLGVCIAASGSSAEGLRLVGKALEGQAVKSDRAMYSLSLCHYGTILRRTGLLERSLDCYREAVAAAMTVDNAYVRLNARINMWYVESLLDEAATPDFSSVSQDAAKRDLHFVAHKATLFEGMLLLNRQHYDLALQAFERCVPSQIRLGHLSLLLQESRSHPELASVLGQERWDCQGLLDLEASQPVPDHAVIRARSPRRLSRQVASLTRRETEVLLLIAEGNRNQEIAQTLFLSPATVKTHVNHIFSKLGVANRVEAILVYQKLASKTEGIDA